MSEPVLDIRRPSPHVAEVWLNRPDVRNAFNDGVIAALTEAFARLNQDADLRVVLLAGHGKAFCAGADLNWMRAMADYSWEENRADAQKLADMLWTLDQCPVPVVGRVHGDCYAGGMGLASVCDVLVASDNVTFCLSEARLGLLPATIGPYVVRAMGEQASRRYFTTAERFSAAQAQAMGFVHELCAPEGTGCARGKHRFGPGGQRPRGGARLQAAGPRRGGPPAG
jgi:methylglutaconyl-CoA hydratase